MTWRQPPAALAALAAVAMLAIPMTAAAQSTFRISQVFSNLDGSIQYIALTETAGLDNQGLFEGLTLTVAHGDVVKQFTFRDNLATAQTAHLTIVVAATPDPGPPPSIADNNGNFIVLAHPDFTVPARFVAADGGTIDFAGVDQVTYPALPGDGRTAWYRDGTFAAGTLPGNYGCGLVPSSKCPGSTLHPTPTYVTAVEYYHATLDRYFITASAAEIDALDSGRIPGWQRTGESLQVGEAASTPFALEYVYPGVAVCRFYVPPADGDSHFLSTSPDECAAIRARFPGWVEEASVAFYAATPNALTQECDTLHSIDFDTPLQPVYRLWDARHGGNHRYTKNAAIRDALVAQGWVPEGAGPLGIAMCV